MRCISLWQPWATLCVIGAKQYETRHWSTDYRGPLLMHAAKRWNGEVTNMVVRPPFREALERGGHKAVWDLPLGAIVGVVELVYVYSTSGHFITGNLGTHVISDTEHAFGDYAEGCFAWKLKNPRKFETPIPYVGRQAFFDVPGELIAEQMAKAVPA